jgi:dTDP-4-dehydrorhamnose reductase
LLCWDRDEVNLAEEDQVREMVRRTEPDLILNASAYTAVDRAESEPDVAFAVNAQAPRILAEEAANRNIPLVHFSTDYVYDGTKNDAWVETDLPNPLIFRASWVYGPHGNNFLFTMLRLGRERDQLSIVDDQIGAPTTSIELANATRSIVGGAVSGDFGGPEHWAGVYHMTCAGSTSWFGFARAIFQRTASLRNGRQPQVTAVHTESYPTPAKRPRNSILSNRKLGERFGFELPRWEVGLQSVIDQLS